MRFGIITIPLTLLLSALPTKAGSNTDDGTAYKPLPGYSFIYVSEAENAVLPDITDSLFNADAQGIRFAVNRTELRPDEPFIRTYRNKILPLLRNKGLVLRRILVRGAASPEGPYENNRRLGNERTRRLVDFIGSQLDSDFHADRIQSSSICEDYDYLIHLMTKASDPEANAVSKIWHGSGGSEEECKRKLQRLHGGKTWQRLKSQYFPTLRQARVMIWFGRKVEEETVNLTIPPNKSTTAIKIVTDNTIAHADTITLTQPVLNDIPLSTIRLPLIAVRTNLVHDFFYMPNFGFAPSGNIQLEYFPSNGHITYNIGFTFSNHRHWQDCKFFQLRDLQLELRRYFRNGHPYRGAFLGAYIHGFAYGIGFNKNRGWEGEGGGGGISYGYTMRLDHKGAIRLELTAALGFFLTKYDPYIYGNPITGELDGKYYYDYLGNASTFKKRNRQFTWLGPTNLGVQLTCDILYHKKKGGHYE